MAVARTAHEKAYMAQAAGINYDILTDQYVLLDGTRIDATTHSTVQTGQIVCESLSPQQLTVDRNHTGIVAQQVKDVMYDKYARITAEDLENAKKKAIKEIVEAINHKYQGRDLLMIKTADLIKLIESI